MAGTPSAPSVSASEHSKDTNEANYEQILRISGAGFSKRTQAEDWL
jgi:hypothetical protein